MKKCVEQENLSAVVAHGGLEGLRLLEKNKDTCSLIILDVMMPDMNGFQVLQKIREKNNVPVLMLTAKSDEEDKVSGLRLGADDYLTKPFGISELMARVNSLIRRYTTLNPVTGNEAATMLLKDMVIDKINRTVTVQNLPVDLTGKEFDLLLFLASNKGRVFLFAVGRSFWFMLLVFLLAGLMRTIKEPVLAAWMNDHVDEKMRATVFSTSGQLDSFGQIIGGPIVGLVAQQVSIPWGLVCTAFLLLPALFLVPVAGKKRD